MTVLMLAFRDSIDIPSGVPEVLGGLAVIAVGLIALYFIVLRNLPEHLDVENGDPDDLSPALTNLAAELAGLGFEVSGPLWTAATMPRTWLLPMVHRGDGTLASVYQPQIKAAPALFDFVTPISDGQGTLTTTGIPQAATLPVPEGSFLQILPGLEPAELLEHHLDAREQLRASGVVPDASADLTADGFLELLRAALSRQRKRFRRAPVRNLLRAVWCTVTGISGHRKPLALQAVTAAVGGDTV